MHAKKCRWKCVGWWPICNFCVCVFCALQVYAPWCCWWLQGEQPWFARLWGYILFFLCVFHQVCLWSVAWRINSQPWVSCSTYTVGNHTQHTKLRSLSILKSFIVPQVKQGFDVGFEHTEPLEISLQLPQWYVGVMGYVGVMVFLLTWLWYLIRLLPSSKAQLFCLAVWLASSSLTAH